MRSRIAKSFRPSFDALENRDNMSSLDLAASSVLPFVNLETSTVQETLLHELVHAARNTGANSAVH